MDLIDEEDRLRVFQFVNDPFEPLFELSSVHGTGNQGAHIQLQDTLVQQLCRHIAVNNCLSQTFHDGRLPDTRFPDEGRVILCAAGKDLDHAFDLIFPSDDRIQLPGCRFGSQVGRQLVHQRRFLFLQPLLTTPGSHFGKFRRRGSLLFLLHTVGGSVFHRAAQFFPDAVFVQSHPCQNTVCSCIRCFDQAQKKVFGTDIIFFRLCCPQHSAPQHILHTRGKHFLRTGNFKGRFFRLHRSIDLTDPVSSYVQIFKHFPGGRALHLDQTEQQMFGTDLKCMTHGSFFVR